VQTSPEDPVDGNAPNLAQRVSSPTWSPWQFFFWNRLWGFDSVIFVSPSHRH